MIFNALKKSAEETCVTVSCEETKILTGYIVEHLKELGRHPEAIEYVDNVRKYVEKVFLERGFLEYEVYAALLNHGIPALPRLRLHCPYERLEEDPVEGVGLQDPTVREIDIVAVVKGDLWLVEVTSSDRWEELEKKRKACSKLISTTNARGALVVHAGSRELSEQLSGGDVSFVSFGWLYSELHRLTWAPPRRRARPPPQPKPLV